MTNGTAPAALCEKTDWQVVCEAGRLAAQQLDDGRWILGDLALLVDKEYGEDKMGDFARECNVPKKRIYEYRQVCGFWEKSVRADIWEIPTVSYSLMRLAMRLENIDAARAFVERCASRFPTIDKAYVVMGRLLGLTGKTKRRAKAIADLVTTYAMSAADVAQAIAAHSDELERKYRIVVYETQ